MNKRHWEDLNLGAYEDVSGCNEVSKWAKERCRCAESQKHAMGSHAMQVSVKELHQSIVSHAIASKSGHIVNADVTNDVAKIPLKNP